MSLVVRNIAANFGGSVWGALMAMLFVPIYIHFIGIEAYGLIGVFATLLALLALLDMGLSTTLNREMARLAVQDDKAREMRDLVRTLEIPYWGVGLAVSVGVVLMSPVITHHWVNAKTLSPNSVQTAIVMMGLGVAFQWPMSFYSGGLMGLQRQVLLNAINIAMATFRGLGAALILWLVSPTVEAFFSWQVGVSAVHVGLVAFFLWRSLPHSPKRPRFRRELLRNIWRFAAGMTGITVLVTILMQLDKVILSRMLSLEMFGYYMLASGVSMSLYYFVVPVFSATYPRFTALLASGTKEEVVDMYHRSAQLVSVLVLPAALVVAFFSKELLLLWTRSDVAAEQSHVLVSLLITATAINGILNIPYALQLASGSTRLPFLGNVIAIPIIVPLMIVLTKWKGAVGAASVWMILNLGYLFISIPIMHRYFLPTEKWRWYVRDVGAPLLAATAVVAIGRQVIKPNWPPLLLVTGIGILSAAAVLAAAWSARELRLIGEIRERFAAIFRTNSGGDPLA